MIIIIIILNWFFDRSGSYRNILQKKVKSKPGLGGHKLTHACSSQKGEALEDKCTLARKFDTPAYVFHLKRSATGFYEEDISLLNQKYVVIAVVLAYLEDFLIISDSKEDGLD